MPSRKPAHSDDIETPPRTFVHYLPLIGTVGIILSPHPSLLYVLVNYHLRTIHAHWTFLIHLLVTYGLTFLMITSLIVVVVRDPGPVTLPNAEDAGDDIGLTDALITPQPDDDFSGPGRWCHKCWAPKPERTHHCSQCGRCVLKMDHHCPWMAQRCIGHRTYPSFVHFLGCITLLSLYVMGIAFPALYYAFGHPYSVGETLPIHELFLGSMGAIFAMVMGSFFAYHLYLISTNQTTLEAMHPYFLLKLIPPLPPSTSPHAPKLSSPPEEHELSRNQRALVRDAHNAIQPYNVGFRKNWAQVFGWNGRWGWAYRLLLGGSEMGNGRTFGRHPRGDEMLDRLAKELVKLD